jgi:hypothetical protein
VYGELDLADALDLDAAVTAGAQALADLGSTEPLDVRRAVAVGDLARCQLTLDLTTGDAPEDETPVDAPAGGQPGPRRATRKPRQVVLYVHLSEAAVTPGADLVGEFGRVENTRGPVHAEQIRQWCAHPDAQVIVKPVLDLNEHLDVEAYEVRGRLREQTVLTHPTCVFPWCTRPSRGLEPGEHDADCDHRIPYAVVQRSCSCNLALRFPRFLGGDDAWPEGLAERRPPCLDRPSSTRWRCGNVPSRWSRARVGRSPRLHSSWV